MLCFLYELIKIWRNLSSRKWLFSLIQYITLKFKLVGQQQQLRCERTTNYHQIKNNSLRFSSIIPNCI